MIDPTFDQDDGVWRDENRAVLHLIGQVDLGFNRISVYENAQKQRFTMYRDEIKGPVWEPMEGNKLPATFSESPLPDAS